MGTRMVPIFVFCYFITFLFNKPLLNIFPILCKKYFPLFPGNKYFCTT